ncbi:putative YigZ family protein [Mesonia maritima]|uniref:YigZ family protein n=1 Tax=Mesonia maritima TaxID=1793873 RepID=A0ABU1K415_9FLAO|nr:YigZ family protein [Mesonia maritima]MDR6300339.1 putative YigZ family protein [Mesonia maritima]
MEKDVYKTILKPGEEGLFKDRGSKFLGYAFPVKNEEDVNFYIEELKGKHHKARHWCYAWQLGKRYEHYRANDDGEPSNSAGMPIYGQLQSFEVTNILVVVVRYFGGTKLGVGGLINAYRTGAQLALENSEIVTKTIDNEYKITFDYPDMNKVMRVLKEKNLNVLKQEFLIDCKIFISVRENEAESIYDIFDYIYGVKIEEVE